MAIFNTVYKKATETGAELQGVWWSPHMIGESTPAPYIVNSNFTFKGGSNPPWGAFSGSETPFAASDAGQENRYLQIYLETPMPLGAFGIKIVKNNTAVAPKSFVFEGSNNGVDWEQLMQRENLNQNIYTAGVYTPFWLDVPVVFRYYRWRDIEPYSSTSPLAIADINFYI